MKSVTLLLLMLGACAPNQPDVDTASLPKPDIHPVLEVPAAPKLTSGDQQDKPSTDTQEGAKITFEKVRYNFGEIYHAEKVNYDFNFTNTGNQLLEIKGVKASCGCTTPTYPSLPIAPGEKGAISVKYNSVGKQGSQKATIRVATNDPTQPEVVLYLSGRVLVKPQEQVEKG